MNLKIGDTPILKILYEYKGRKNSIYAKLEYYNFSGSVKDRVALKIIESAMKSGKLKKGKQYMKQQVEILELDMTLFLI